MPETPDRTLSRLIESRVERMPDALALREGRAVAEALDGQLSIAGVLRMQAESRPEAPAILAPGRIPLAYGPLWRQVEGLVEMLNALGVGRGDRVGVVLPQGPEMAVAILAVASGATAVPLSPLHRKPEYERHLAERKIGTLIVQAGVDSAARTVARARGLRVIELQPLSEAEAGRFTLSAGSTAPAAGLTPAQPDDVAFVLTTSGTTTHGKTVPLTHVNVLAGSARTVGALELTPADRCLNLMPVFHSHGLAAGLIASLLAGGGVACVPAFDEAQFFRWIEELGPTWYTGVPAMHEAILARAAEQAAALVHHRLRFIRSASVTLPGRVRQQLESVFGIPVTESYGLTEATQLTNTSLSPSLYKPGSVGVAAPGFELAIMDAAGRLLSAGEAGEIVARGPNVIRGYENAPDLNARVFTHGWFRTGDEGFLDAEGYLFLTDRLDDIINRGGEKIAPREVEEVLASHPAVAQATVFAVPHPTLGHDVAAAVALKPGAVRSDERALREFAAARLADFKVPRQIAIVDRLPTTPIGKVSRRRVGESLGLVASRTDAGSGAPRTEIELALAEICRGVLRLDVVRVEDNLFALGADSISASRILAQARDALGVELPLIRFFQAPTVADLVAAVEEARGAPAARIPSLTPTLRSGELPLSFAQQRLWFLDQLEPGTATYNVVVAYHLSGELDAKALEASLREVVRRHATLRTTFPSIDGQPVQVILPSVDLGLALESLDGWPETEREERARRAGDRGGAAALRPCRGPLFRAKLLRLSREAHVLVLGMHHIVSDGWSLERAGPRADAPSTPPLPRAGPRRSPRCRSSTPTSPSGSGSGSTERGSSGSSPTGGNASAGRLPCWSCRRTGRARRCRRPAGATVVGRLPAELTRAPRTRSAARRGRRCS